MRFLSGVRATVGIYFLFGKLFFQLINLYAKETRVHDSIIDSCTLAYLFYVSIDGKCLTHTPRQKNGRVMWSLQPLKTFFTVDLLVGVRESLSYSPRSRFPPGYSLIYLHQFAISFARISLCVKFSFYSIP